MKLLPRIALIAFCILLASFTTAQTSRLETADLALVNGRIWTGADFVEAIAVRGNQIARVGTTAEIKQLAGKVSLIPRDKTYVQQLQRFKAQCQAAGIHHVHGHRHHYAQQRYRELAG